MMADVQFELELTELADDKANDSDDDIIEVDEVSLPNKKSIYYDLYFFFILLSCIVVLLFYCNSFCIFMFASVHGAGPLEQNRKEYAENTWEK